MNLYYGEMIRGDSSLYLVATDEGLHYVGSKSGGIDEINNWVKKVYPQAKLKEDYEKITKYVNQLTEYMDGKRKGFEVDIVFKGTPFQESVWKALQTIPYGETRSYSDIAKSVGNEKAVRAVGSAIGANPIAIIVPCHRVIGKNGSLSGYRGGIEMKKDLLTIEGIINHEVT